jgi:putative hydrolase of the HAD superfamily
MPARARQHLIFDADDTLWENNVVFEGVIADFIAWLDHPRMTVEEVRRVMDGIEREHAARFGYGTKVFELTLEETVRRLHDGRLTAADAQQIALLMARLRWDRLDIIDGVPETLTQLRRRHDLLLLTKGDQEEQVRKIERSGLAELFRRTLVTPEKTEATYRGVVADERLDARTTWMIGNSPKSDILPAVAAGLRAVFIAHPHTWRLEVVALPENDARILRVATFRDLATLF